MDAKLCAHCGKVMKKGRQARKQWDARKYCSYSCGNLAGARQVSGNNQAAVDAWRYGDGPFAALMKAMPIPVPVFHSIERFYEHACHDHDKGF